MSIIPVRKELPTNSSNPPVPADQSLTPDLLELIRQQGIPLESIKHASANGAAEESIRTFRITLSNGRSMKGRCYPNHDAIERALAIQQEVDLAGFPRVISRLGCAVLEAWISGEVLSESLVLDEHLEASGRLLGQLHTYSCLPGLGKRLTGTRGRCQRLKDRLARLAARQLLSAEQADRLLCIAVEAAPHQAERGFVHRDFHPRNLVWTGTDIRCIDNATMNFGPYDEDLARVWLLWPMDNRQWRVFWSGYQQSRDTTSFNQHFAFWAVNSSVSCLQFRLTSETYDPQEPLSRLIDICKDPKACSPVTRVPHPR